MSRKNQQSAFTVVELIIVAAILLIAGTFLGGVGCSCVGCYSHYSSGERTGTIVKFSQKGLYFKSWEGQMHLGVGQAALGAAVWDFSVRDEAIVEKVQAALDAGKPVTVHYHQWMAKPISIETVYVVDAVRPQGQGR